jgi:hypothetical protein
MSSTNIIKKYSISILDVCLYNINILRNIFQSMARRSPASLENHQHHPERTITSVLIRPLEEPDDIITSILITITSILRRPAIISIRRRQSIASRDNHHQHTGKIIISILRIPSPAS